MKQVATLVVVAMVLTTAPKAFTQAVSSQSGTLVPGITQSFGFVPAGTVISPKQHAPFSAVIIEQMEETLADGTHITRSNEEAVKRDGMGRIYRARTIKVVERERTAASKGAPGATPRQIITITDPV